MFRDTSSFSGNTPSGQSVQPDAIHRAYVQSENMGRAAFQTGLATLQIGTIGLSNLFGAVSTVSSLAFAQSVAHVTSGAKLADSCASLIPRCLP